MVPGVRDQMRVVAVLGAVAVGVLPRDMNVDVSAGAVGVLVENGRAVGLVGTGEVRTVGESAHVAHGGGPEAAAAVDRTPFRDLARIEHRRRERGRAGVGVEHGSAGPDGKRNLVVGGPRELVKVEIVDGEADVGGENRHRPLGGGRPAVEADVDVVVTAGFVHQFQNRMGDAAASVACGRSEHPLAVLDPDRGGREGGNDDGRRPQRAAGAHGLFPRFDAERNDARTGGEEMERDGLARPQAKRIGAGLAERQGEGAKR